MRGWFSGPGIGVLDTRYLRLDASNDPVTAGLHIDQANAGGAEPVLLLDQADVSEEFINFTIAGDQDMVLAKLSVAGTPTINWDESEDAFNLSNGLTIGTTKISNNGAIHVGKFSGGSGIAHKVYVHSQNAGNANEYLELFSFGLNSSLRGGANQDIKLESRGTGAVIIDTGNGQVVFREGSTTAYFFDFSIAFDQACFGLAVATGSQLVVTSRLNSQNDHDHATGTDPVLYMHSSLNPDFSNNQWGSFHHDQEDFIITTGVNVGAGSAPTTDDNSIKLKPRGAESGRFDSSAVARDTRFMLYDVDNAQMERVSVGIADSGGAGFKVLRIPN